jgi:SAM-dependent methyltransferase
MEPSPAEAPAGVSPRFWSLLVAEPLRHQDALDVGTGTGRLALSLAPHCRHVLGLDRDPAAIEEATHRAAARGLTNVEFVVLDADKAGDYRGLATGWTEPGLIVAHLCVSDAIIEASARSLDRGGVLAFVAFHTDQWRETGRRSRFAYDETHARRVLGERGFAIEHLEVEREVQHFDSVEAALAAAIGLQERWRADGRWFHYVRFLEQGGRTLTRSHLIVKARRR